MPLITDKKENLAPNYGLDISALTKLLSAQMSETMSGVEDNLIKKLKPLLDKQGTIVESGRSYDSDDEMTIKELAMLAARGSSIDDSNIDKLGKSFETEDDRGGEIQDLLGDLDI